MKNTFFPHLFPGEHVLSMFARRLRFNVLRSVEVEQRALTSTNVSLTSHSKTCQRLFENKREGSAPKT